ncbi:MAG: hypothetical protein ACLU9S_02210 [Oscillospiraceae bacterium]
METGRSIVGRQAESGLCHRLIQWRPALPSGTIVPVKINRDSRARSLTQMGR